MVRGKKVVLVTQYYRAASAARQRDIDECLRRNATTVAALDEIHALVEEPFSELVPYTANALAPVKEVVLGKRLTFALALDYMRSLPEDEYDLCVLSNADIFFDDTLFFVRGLRLGATVGLALSRWDMLRPECPKEVRPVHESLGWSLKDASMTQDTWVFRTPVPPVDIDPTITVGSMWGCENRFAAACVASGVRLYNPFMHIRCTHVHFADAARATAAPRLAGPYVYVPPCALEQVGGATVASEPKATPTSASTPTATIATAANPAPAPAPAHISCHNAVFNGDGAVRRIVARMAALLNIRCAVETGTFMGHTTTWLGETFDRVVAVEHNADYARRTTERVRAAGLDNVVVLQGDSGNATIMEEAVTRAIGSGGVGVGGAVLFYLDAHWENDWPLLSEIRTIGRLMREKAEGVGYVVIIDDFQTPGRPNYGFDAYHDQPNNLDFVRDALSESIPNHTLFFLGDSQHPTCAGVGKLFCLSAELAHQREAFAHMEDDGLYYTPCAPPDANATGACVPTLHVLGVPHTVASHTESSCAFTTNVLLFSKMMHMYPDWRIVEYGNEGSESEADEHVVVLRAGQMRALAGQRHRTTEDFSCTFASALEPAFSRIICERLAARVKARDIVLHAYGPLRAATLAAPQCVHLELNVGYEGTGLQHRVYVSSAWMHYHYGKEGLSDGFNYRWVIPLWYDTAAWAEAQQRAVAGAQLGTDACLPWGMRDYVLFFGRITPHKGLATLVEIARRMPEVTFVVCGQGDPGTISGYNLANLLYRKPLCGGPEVRGAALYHARCVVMPTVYIEPFGSSGVEATLVGTPFLGTAFGGFCETIDDGVNGFCCHTLEDWVCGIRAATTLDRNRIALAAREKYSLRRVGGMYDAALRELYDLQFANKGWYAQESHRARWPFRIE